MNLRKIIGLTLASVITVTSVQLLTICGAGAENDKVNLLTDGGFETTSDFTAIGDWTFKTYNTWYSGGTLEAEGENHYASVTGTGIGQNVAVTAGTPYRLTAKVKTTGTVQLCIQNGDADYPGDLTNQKLASTDVSSTEWQTVTVDYDGSASISHLFVYLWSEGSITSCIDDVSLTELEIQSDIVNPKFENNTEGWTLTNTTNMTVKDGVLTAEGTDYEAKISQTVTGLENGTYNLSATVTNTDITGEYYLYGKTAGHTSAQTAIPQTSAAMRIVVPSIVVEDGTCEIGMYTNGSSTVTLDNLSLVKSEDTRIPFLKGGEISKLTYVEDMGAKFYRTDGTEGDALQIMAENGFNLARIRILDDPGKGHGDPEFYLPAGYMTEDDCLHLARRAKDKGMQILFSFAYSDFWVDGDKQYIPHRWQEEITAQGLSGEDMYKYLEDKTYEYTKQVMLDLIAQDTCPEYVSIGNEIQVGIYFGNSKLKDSSFKSALYNNADMLARFLNAGARAVRETSPSTKIILHSDNGGKLSQRNTFKQALTRVGNNFDVIGVSYYPFYNADVSIDTVVNEFNDLIRTYNKDVIIMETGYNWNEYKYGGPWEGQLENSGYYQDIYGETQEGQRAFLTELYAKLKQVSGGRCIGDCYWDPIMIHSKDYKIGWAMKEADDYPGDNVVPNSTIFDFDGKATQGQLAMKHNTNSSDTIKITGTVFNPRHAGENKAESPLLSNSEITLTVNSTKYNTSTDSFGRYILSVPYPQSGTLAISMTDGQSTYNTAAPSNGFMLDGIDFTTESYIQEVKPEIDSIDMTKGKMTIRDNTHLDGEARGIIALYDDEGILQKVYMSDDIASKGRKVLSFSSIEDIEGATIKAFLWKNGQDGRLSQKPAAEHKPFGKIHH